MLATAAEVGYSETGFLVAGASGRFAVRYFSPLAEVPFCGHATIASAVAYAERHGPGTMRYETRAGEVAVETRADASGMTTATLTSVPPQVAPLEAADEQRLLAALRWSADELDPALPTRVAYAGAWHPVVAVRDRARLADLDYHFAALGELMAERGWTTVALVWREGPDRFDVRNPFPPGGVVEDPATGAAAAALGGYLRELGLVELVSRSELHVHRRLVERGADPMHFCPAPGVSRRAGSRDSLPAIVPALTERTRRGGCVSLPDAQSDRFCSVPRWQPSNTHRHLCGHALPSSGPSLCVPWPLAAVMQ